MIYKLEGIGAYPKRSILMAAGLIAAAQKIVLEQIGGSPDPAGQLWTPKRSGSNELHHFRGLAVTALSS